jgi:predicted ArsR family transcriptional regulator
VSSKQTSLDLRKKSFALITQRDYNETRMSPNPPPARKNIISGLATRERILAYLQENRVASVQSLSRAWGLTRADIRYHFNALLAEGILERVPRDRSQPAPRGRPEQRFRLASGSAPDNYPRLCAALLDALLYPLPTEQHEPVLQVLAERLTTSFISGGSLFRRFHQAIVFLNQSGYRARWEAYASGPRILLHNCPYAEILPAHPELCALDRFVLERLVQVSLQQTARMNLAGGRPVACIFTSGVGVDKP